MNNSLIQGSVPELNIAGTQLDALGFNTDTPFRVTRHDNSLTVAIVTDEAEWKELCIACSDRGSILHGRTG
ncbi:hypothetical protein ABEH00_00770 [Pantoea agglomerans]|uniref:hypothetical protein n=1 Tax=Enterobacter agglomerans TaxID=549 RepID=UPI00292A563A|nr:hypothetical protein [Pantoea agglomerans]